MLWCVALYLGSRIFQVLGKIVSSEFRVRKLEEPFFCFLKGSSNFLTWIVGGILKTKSSEFNMAAPFYQQLVKPVHYTAH